MTASTRYLRVFVTYSHHVRLTAPCSVAPPPQLFFTHPTVLEDTDIKHLWVRSRVLCCPQRVQRRRQPWSSPERSGIEFPRWSSRRRRRAEGRAREERRRINKLPVGAGVPPMLVNPGRRRARNALPAPRLQRPVPPMLALLHRRKLFPEVLMLRLLPMCRRRTRRSRKLKERQNR